MLKFEELSKRNVEWLKEYYLYSENTNTNTNDVFYIVNTITGMTDPVSADTTNLITINNIVLL